jgi:hypothetical protein
MGSLMRWLHRRARDKKPQKKIIARSAGEKIIMNTNVKRKYTVTGSDGSKAEFDSEWDARNHLAIERASSAVLGNKTTYSMMSKPVLGPGKEFEEFFDMRDEDGNLIIELPAPVLPSVLPELFQNGPGYTDLDSLNLELAPLLCPETNRTGKEHGMANCELGGNYFAQLPQAGTDDRIQMKPCMVGHEAGSTHSHSNGDSSARQFMGPMDQALSEYGTAYMIPCGAESQDIQKFSIPDSSRGKYPGQRIDTILNRNGLTEPVWNADYIQWLLDLAPDYPKFLNRKD